MVGRLGSLPERPLLLDDSAPRSRERVHDSVLDFASGRTTGLFRQIGSSSHYALAVSPDEEWILYNEWPEWQSELMLVENFR